MPVFSKSRAEPPPPPEKKRGRHTYPHIASRHITNSTARPVMKAFRFHRALPGTGIAALLAAVALLTLAPVAALAQEGPSPGGTREQTGPRRFWQAELPGGEYSVALDRIASVGKHSYVVDGNLSVTEVTIDTLGSVTARFYFTTPFTPDSPAAAGQVLVDRARNTLDVLGDRTGASQAENLVIKNYPTTTHARTIEFNIPNLNDLNDLYESINGAFTSGRGARFTVRGN